MCQFCCQPCKKIEKDCWFFNSSGIPVPGENGVLVNQFLHVKLLLTGWTDLFGDFVAAKQCSKHCQDLCLNRGKRSLKTLCQSFGGHVLCEMSGQVDLLVVGNDPSKEQIHRAELSSQIVTISIQIGTVMLVTMMLIDYQLLIKIFVIIRS